MDKAAQTDSTASGRLGSGGAGAVVEHTSPALVIIEDRVNRLDDATCALAIVAGEAADLLDAENAMQAAALRWCSGAIASAVIELAGDIRAFKRDLAWQVVRPVAPAGAAGWAASSVPDQPAG